MPAPAWRDFANQTSGNGTSIVITASDITGLANDDILVAFLYKESTASYTATPSGWNQLSGFPADQTTGGFKYRADVWWKRAASESGTYTWSWSGSTWRAGMVGVWSGCVTTETPLVTFASDFETAQNDQPSHPGITVARNNSGLVFTDWNFAGTGSTPPTGYTERVGGSNEMEINDDLTVSPGATGTVTSTLANPEYAASILIELATEAAAQDTPELHGRPFGLRGSRQMHALLAQ